MLPKKTWYYIETTTPEHRRALPHVVCAESPGKAMTKALHEHAATWPEDQRLEPEVFQPISAEKARDILAYIATGDWNGWPLGVRVEVS